jgi:hypothetical protein
MNEVQGTGPCQIALGTLVMVGRSHFDDLGYIHFF